MNPPYDRPPDDTEHLHLVLSDDQVDKLAAKLAPMVAKILKKDMFADIGETVVRKAFYVIGVGALMLAAWLQGKGFFK